MKLSSENFPCLLCKQYTKMLDFCIVEPYIEKLYQTFFEKMYTTKSQFAELINRNSSLCDRCAHHITLSYKIKLNYTQKFRQNSITMCLICKELKEEQLIEIQSMLANNLVQVELFITSISSSVNFIDDQICVQCLGSLNIWFETRCAAIKMTKRGFDSMLVANNDNSAATVTLIQEMSPETLKKSVTFTTALGLVPSSTKISSFTSDDISTRMTKRLRSSRALSKSQHADFTGNLVKKDKIPRERPKLSLKKPIIYSDNDTEETTNESLYYERETDAIITETANLICKNNNTFVSRKCRHSMLQAIADNNKKLLSSIPKCSTPTTVSKMITKNDNHGSSLPREYLNKRLSHLKTVDKSSPNKATIKDSYYLSGDNKMFYQIPYVSIKFMNILNVVAEDREEGTTSPPPAKRTRLSRKHQSTDIVVDLTSGDEKEKEEENFVCRVCEKTFIKIYDLQAHLLYHLQPEYLVVNVVRENFENRSLLNNISVDKIAEKYLNTNELDKKLEVIDNDNISIDSPAAHQISTKQLAEERQSHCEKSTSISEVNENNTADATDEMDSEDILIKINKVTSGILNNLDTSLDDEDNDNDLILKISVSSSESDATKGKEVPSSNNQVDCSEVQQSNMMENLDEHDMTMILNSESSSNSVPDDLENRKNTFESEVEVHQQDDSSLASILDIVPNTSLLVQEDPEINNDNSLKSFISEYDSFTPTKDTTSTPSVEAKLARIHGILCASSENTQIRCNQSVDFGVESMQKTKNVGCLSNNSTLMTHTLTNQFNYYLKSRMREDSGNCNLV